MNRVTLFLTLVLAGCSDPEYICATPQPPEEFDHPPFGAFIVRAVPQIEVFATCDALSPGGFEGGIACSGGNLMVIPEIGDGVTYKQQACLIHHEWGHMNGASADHSGWIFL